MSDGILPAALLRGAEISGHYELPLMGGMLAAVARSEPTHAVGPLGARASIARSGMTTAMPGPHPNLRKLSAFIAVGVLQLPTPMIRAHLLQ